MENFKAVMLTEGERAIKFEAAPAAADAALPVADRTPERCGIGRKGMSLLDHHPALHFLLLTFQLLTHCY